MNQIVKRLAFDGLLSVTIGAIGALGRTAKFSNFKQTTVQMDLAEMGQVLMNKEFEEHCNVSHLNYEDSPWSHAKRPYTPFIPKVDSQYKFKFKEAVRNNGAIYKHYKLDAIFSGNPMASLHEEFQKQATPPEE